MLKTDIGEHEQEISAVIGRSSRSNPGRWFRRLLSWTLMILLIAAAIFYFKEHNREQPLQYKSQAAVEGDLTVTVSATGTLEPTNQVDVGSELSGIMQSVEVDYNDKVTVGQILAKLETSKLKADVMKSQATLDSVKGKVLQVEATLTETRKNFERIKYARMLTNNKAPSQEVLDQAHASFQRAKADLISSKAAVSEASATLESAKTDLAKAIIRSPINGVVLTRSVDPGQTMAASLESPVLFTLAEDLTQMELHVDVDEADVSLVTYGQSALFSVDAYPDQTFPATIRQVRYGAQTTDGVVTYETVLSVNNSAMLLRPGMTATADITVKKIDQALLIPNAALRFTPPVTLTQGDERASKSGGFLSRLLPVPPRSRSMSKKVESKPSDEKGQIVWIIGSDGRPEEVSITAGETDGTMTQVLSGAIKPGMKLVVDSDESQPE